MDTLFIGDLHGRSSWKSIIQKHPSVKRIVFMGDYFDSHLISYTKQIDNFLDIIHLKEKGDIEVIMLIGNHDHHYFPDVILDNISKYSSEPSQAIIAVISKNRHHLQMAFQIGSIVCTHAGVGETFLKRELGLLNWSISQLAENINKLFIQNPIAFKFKGFNPTGDDIGQTPIWIRPKSLLIDSMNLKKNIIQIVGHTPMINITSSSKMGNDRYYFIDTLGGSCQYLLLNEKDEIIVMDFV